MKRIVLVGVMLCGLISLCYGRTSWNELNRTVALKTARITIGHVGSTGENYQFTSAANTNEQVLTITSVLPAYARLVDVQLVNKEAAVFSGGATTLVAEIGTSSSGNQIATSATIYELAAIVQPTTGTTPLVSTASSAASLYVSATPGRNWEEMTAGQWVLLVTYIDNSMSI